MNKNRKDILLRAAYDLLKKADKINFLFNTFIITILGFCVGFTTLLIAIYIYKYYLL